MKKINRILSILIIILIVLISLKYIKMEKNFEYLISDSDASESDIRYEIEREILYGEDTKYADFDESGKRYNISPEMKKEKILDNNIIVKDASIVYSNDRTEITAIVTNNSENKQEKSKAYMDLYNDSNEVVSSIPIIIPSLEANEEKKILSGLPGDITSIYKYEIRKAE